MWKCILEAASRTWDSNTIVTYHIEHSLPGKFFWSLTEIIFLISLEMGMSLNLHKSQVFFVLSLQKTRVLESEPQPPRHEHDEMHAFPRRPLSKVQTNRESFLGKIVCLTLTIMPAKQNVCKKLCKPPYFEKSIKGINTEEEVNKEKLLIM